MNAIDKLLEISSNPISSNYISILDNRNHSRMRKYLDKLSKDKLIELDCILKRKNGFVTFESSLHLFSTGNTQKSRGLSFWNDDKGWKSYYKFNETLLFFAQDVFASQFAISDSGIVRLNPETGKLSYHSESLEQWASKILADYSYETGWKIASEWQKKNGISLNTDFRLLPKKPFVLGGEYAIDNLVAIDPLSAMEKLGLLYSQIKNIPNGEKIVIKGWI